MYLEKILGTKTKIRILNELTNHPNKKYIETELAKTINTSISEVNRQIKDLVTCGLITIEKIGRTKIYSINAQHFLYPSLKNLFQDLTKTYRKIAKEITKHITKTHKIECIILTGSLAKGKISQDIIKNPSDIDLIFITKKESEIPKLKKDLIKYVEKKINTKYGINIYPIIIPKQEYIKGLEKDKFIIKIHATGEVLYGKKPLWSKMEPEKS